MKRVRYVVHLDWDETIKSLCAIQCNGETPTGREWRWSETDSKWIELSGPPFGWAFWKLMLEPMYEETLNPAHALPADLVNS